MDNKVRFELAAEKLDQMHRSLSVLALGDWTVIKGICNNRFQILRFLQAGNVPYLPFNIANLDQIRVLQNGCGKRWVSVRRRQVFLKYVPAVDL